MVRVLLGSESSPLRAYAIAWAAVGGWAMGACFYISFMRAEPHGFLLAVPAGFLSAMAMGRATRAERKVPSVIVGYSVLASLVCPFATLASLMLVAAAVSSHPEAVPMIGALIGGSLIGTFFAAPLGLVFGIVFSLVWRLLDDTRAYHRAATEHAQIRGGAALSALGLVILGISVLMPTLRLWHGWGEHDPSPDMMGVLGLIVVLVGAVVAAGGLLRSSRRQRWAKRIERGEVDGYALVPANEVEGVEELPRLFAPGAQERVLVRRESAARGPFRSSEPSVPIARL